MNFYGKDISSLKPLDINSLSFGIGVSSKGVAVWLFSLVLFFVFVMAVIMFWHWNKYAMSKGRTLIMEVLYVLGSASFIISALTFLSKI